MNIIVAYDRDRAIGYKNQLLYKISNDMRRFKELTTGEVVIMGENTFKSLPKRPLPNRINVVLSEDAHIFDGLENTDNCVRSISLLNSVEEYEKLGYNVFVIGGAYVYKCAVDIMKSGDKIYATEILNSGRKADTYFPEIDLKDFDVIEGKINDTDMYDYRFVTYVKTKKEPNVENTWYISSTTNPDIKITNVEYKIDNVCSVTATNLKGQDSITINIDPKDFVSDYNFKKIFLSLPMSGQEDSIRQRYSNAVHFINEFISSDAIIVTQDNFFEIADKTQSLTDEQYNFKMIDDLKRLCECDIVVFGLGWEQSKGCSLEFEAAKTFSKTIYYEF